MKKLYDKVNKCQTSNADDPNAIELPESNCFWSPIPAGYYMDFEGDDNIPVLVEIEEAVLKLDALNQLYFNMRDAAKYSIDDIELSTGTHSFNFDRFSMEDFKDTREACKIDSVDRAWKTKANTFIDLTSTDFDTIFLAIELKSREIFDAYQLDKTAIGEGDYTLSNLTALGGE